MPAARSRRSLTVTGETNTRREFGIGDLTALLLLVCACTSGAFFFRFLDISFRTCLILLLTKSCVSSAFLLQCLLAITSARTILLVCFSRTSSHFSTLTDSPRPRERSGLAEIYALHIFQNQPPLRDFSLLWLVRFMALDHQPSRIDVGSLNGQ